MLKQIRTVRCTHIMAQISLGFYDANGNLIGEEVFPQGDTGPLVAKLFHPHAEELVSLIEMCVGQAWEKLSASGRADGPRCAEKAGENGSPARPAELAR